MRHLFISKEARLMYAKIMAHRSNEEISELGNELYNKLKEDIAKAKQYRGRDYITYTPERNIGKTYNLVKLATEFDYPIVVPNNNWGKMLRRESRWTFGKEVETICFSSLGITTDGINMDVLLKEEMIDIVELRYILNKNNLYWVSVVGIN